MNLKKTYPVRCGTRRKPWLPVDKPSSTKGENSFVKLSTEKKKIASVFTLGSKEVVQLYTVYLESPEDHSRLEGN